MTLDKTAASYWKANLKIIWICMSIWALVSYGFGIILRPLLSGIRIGGTDLGFWFAQQGSILTFIALIGPPISDLIIPYFISFGM